MSDLLSDAKQAGGVSMTRDSSGIRYECTFLVPDTK